jgi:acyl-CoA synthetase (AMP-forming)/AMP-acid ligase II
MDGNYREVHMTQNSYSLAEPWNGLTLTGLLSSAASAHPNRVFLADCPRRMDWAGTPPQILTFQKVWEGAQFFARQLYSLGIGAEETVLLLLPNIVEFPVAVLGTLLAGAVPAIAPVDESVERLRAMAERCNATAIITLDRIDDIALADKARQVAAKVISIRCVAGYGTLLPEGVIPLDGWSEEDLLPQTSFPPAIQDRLSLITFARRKGGICAFLRAEGQLIADMLAIAAILKPGSGSAFLTSLQPGAAASFVAGFAIPLFLGARTQLSGPFDGEALALLAGANAGAYLIAPQHLHDALEQARDQGILPQGFDALAGTITHARAGDGGLAVSPRGSKGALLLADFDEAAMIACTQWPEAGAFAVPNRLQHPMLNILFSGRMLLERLPDEDGMMRFGGFSAAVMLRRDDMPAQQEKKTVKAA